MLTLSSSRSTSEACAPKKIYMLPEFLLFFVYCLVSTQMWAYIEAFFSQTNILNKLSFFYTREPFSPKATELIELEPFIPERIKNGWMFKNYDRLCTCRQMKSRSLVHKAMLEKLKLILNKHTDKLKKQDKWKYQVVPVPEWDAG